VRRATNLASDGGIGSRGIGGSIREKEEPACSFGAAAYRSRNSCRFFEVAGPLLAYTGVSSLSCSSYAVAFLVFVTIILFVPSQYVEFCPSTSFFLLCIYVVDMCISRFIEK